MRQMEAMRERLFGTGRRRLRALFVALLCMGFGATSAAAEDLWPSYLDYAYVYSSADAASLRARLDQYGKEAGISLDQYISREFSYEDPKGQAFDEGAKRREAIAYLLQYLAEGEPTSLDRAVDAVVALKERLGRHENRYWYHYVMAHHALEGGEPYDFVAEVLDLWLGVVSPLETPYETMHTLSLSDSANSGFVSALPYVFENLTRLVLLRSQEMGMNRGLDPLAAVIRMLHDGRVGAHPDVIPPEASSFDYLDRIVARLDGAESDNGSLTFTLALFEASKLHDKARSSLAQSDLSPETVRAIELAAGAYEVALNRAETVQGKASVYTRVLRQLGEVYAAKQRLGVDPEIEIPFTIEGAIEVYATLHKGLTRGWGDLGYRQNGREAFINSTRGLWEEIQETSLNGADYYLTRSTKTKVRSDDFARSAARIYDRYLAFFKKFATPQGKEAVPESAYFAAYEAARGFGDALMRYGTRRPKPTEVELAANRFQGALFLFPFDRDVWAGITDALEKQGRENEYMGMARPVAEAVTRSRAVDAWISNNEEGHEIVATYRRAFSDSLVMMYLGFADDERIDELESSLGELKSEKQAAERELDELMAMRDKFENGESMPAAPAPEVGSGTASLGDVKRRIGIATDRLGRLEKQIAARSRALPLFREVLEVPSLGDELRQRRDHPVHKLLRRMYHEGRVSKSKRR